MSDLQAAAQIDFGKRNLSTLAAHKWSEYAPSVKQTLNSPYADQDPIYGDAGWSYLYYQEEQEGKDPETLSSNRAMRACLRDEVPIGVLRQLTPKPNVSYSELGLAKIIGKAAGYYLLDGSGTGLQTATMSKTRINYDDIEIPSGILEIGDTRIRRLRSVVQRQGQPRFREQLMQIYERKCAISACDVSEVLEAAHVVPYRGAHTNESSNGIILRADLHILFDEGLLAVRPDSLSVQLAPAIRSNIYYGKFDGASLHEGCRKLDRELLVAHMHYCGF